MDTKLNKRAQSLTRRAWWHLLWERMAPPLALGVLCALLFISAATFGLWQRIGDPWRAIGLLVAIYFMAKSIYRARLITMPTRSQARRRVEQDSGLYHRPLDVLEDSPALARTDLGAWTTHRDNARRQIQRAGTSSLRPALAPIDAYYLRYLAPIILLLAFMVGYGDNYERVYASLKPSWMHAMSAKSAHYEAWITPPEYTARPPSYFKGKTSMAAPSGSEFVARISGVKTAPRLVVRTGAKTRRITPKRLGPQSFEARTIVNADASASFRIGKQSQTWQLKIDPDNPPTVKFDDPPAAGKRDRLIFTYSLEDDYGVKTLLLSLALLSDPERSAQINLPLPGSNVRSAKNEPSGLDLTKHKWAGKKVVGHLIAVDGVGQIGLSETHEFVIPDKIFVEPLAKAVAEQRQLILSAATDEYAPLKPKADVDLDDFANRALYGVDRPERSIGRAPKPVQRTALLIAAVTDQPVGVFKDPSVYMGLRNVYRRIVGAYDRSDLAGIPEDLWAIALRAEFGLLGDARADMIKAERALNNAMARRAPQREIDALFERYNQAVDRYMEALMLEAAKNAKNQNGDTENNGGDSFQADQIQELLDAIEEANRMGDTVAARKALAKLAQLLENMQIQLSQGGGSGSGMGSSMSEELKQALEELNEILGEQRDLRDDTLGAGREQADQNSGPQDEEEKPSKPDAGAGKNLAKTQKKIAEMMEALEKNAGNMTQGGDRASGGEPDEKSSAIIDKAIKDAKDAMNRSGEALEKGEFYRAGRAQTDAIDALREAGEGLLAQEAKRLEADQQNAKDGKGTGKADPFGRENGNGDGDSDVTLPEKSDQQRARELLDELRKRSGERERDKIERDYLERLLERF